MVTVDPDKFVGRPFSFEPPILNVKHNEWVFQKSTWAEVLVANTKAEMEIWVPRRFLGEVSRVEEPVMSVGLRHELEYRAGGLFPHKLRGVEMPAGPRSAPSPATELPERSRASESSESAAEKRVTKLILSVLLVAVIGAFLAILLVRARESGGRINFETVLQTELGLTSADNYFAVVRKLGEPAEDRWRSQTGEQQFRALSYPDLGITVILMGADRENTFYIGAKDMDWRNAHTVKLPGGGSTDSILRALPRF